LASAIVVTIFAVDHGDQYVPVGFIAALFGFFGIRLLMEGYRTTGFTNFVAGRRLLEGVVLFKVRAEMLGIADLMKRDATMPDVLAGYLKEISAMKRRLWILPRWRSRVRQGLTAPAMTTIPRLCKMPSTLMRQLMST
jgi:hypothetical protein